MVTVCTPRARRLGMLGKKDFHTGSGGMWERSAPGKKLRMLEPVKSTCPPPWRKPGSGVCPPPRRSLRSEAAIPTGIRAPPLGGAVRGDRREPRRDWHTRFFRAERSKRQAARDERALRPAPQERVRAPEEDIREESL